MIKKTEIKKEFNKRGVRAGKRAIQWFIRIEEGKIEKDIEKIARELRISGTKTMKKADLGIIE